MWASILCILITKMKRRNNSLFYKRIGLEWIGNRKIKCFIARDSSRTSALGAVLGPMRWVTVRIKSCVYETITALQTDCIFLIGAAIKLIHSQKDPAFSTPAKCLRKRESRTENTAERVFQNHCLLSQGAGPCSD